MKIYSIISITILFIFGAFKMCAQTVNSDNLTFPSTFTEAQKELIINNLSEFPINTQVSIAVIKGDKTEYLGIKNKDSQLKNVENRDSVFEIGSITKVMTSTLLANAILSGLVSSSTEISELLGYPLLKDGKITLEQLSNHTSGMMRMPGNFMFAQMKDPNNPYIHYDETALKTWLTEYMTTELKHDSSNYSNLGAALLAYGLTKKYNKSYEDLLQEQIFQKLEMENSTTNLEKVKERVIYGQDAKGQTCKNWEFDVLEGAGAVLSSISDMEKFARAVMSQKDEALNLQRKPTFTVNDKLDIGLGWHIFHGKGGHTFYWHNGGTNGYTSSFIVDVERQLAFIILSNLSVFHTNMGNIDGLTFGFMKTLNN
jgi:CubicO group peptidase (beta-lactamase class C family)